jgi:predicted nucleic-acid-binding protein
MRAADTNILVRIVVRDNERQAEAADRFIETGAWVSLLAFAEAAWVLRSSYRFDPAQLASTIHMLLNHINLVHQDADTVAAALELFRARPALGFSDCLMLELARKAGNLPLGTFDRALGKVDGAQKL